MSKVDYKKITDSDEVIDLMKQRETLEEKISSIDSEALMNYEIELLRVNWDWE